MDILSAAFVLFLYGKCEYKPPEPSKAPCNNCLVTYSNNTLTYSIDGSECEYKTFKTRADLKHYLQFNRVNEKTELYAVKDGTLEAMTFEQKRTPEYQVGISD